MECFTADFPIFPKKPQTLASKWFDGYHQIFVSGIATPW